MCCHETPTTTTNATRQDMTLRTLKTHNKNKRITHFTYNGNNWQMKKRLIYPVAREERAG